MRLASALNALCIVLFALCIAPLSSASDKSAPRLFGKGHPFAPRGSAGWRTQESTAEAFHVRSRCSAVAIAQTCLFRRRTEVVAHRFTPRGGFWDFADNNTYTATVQPNQVRDISGNPAATTSQTFTVNVPAFSLASVTGPANGSYKAGTNLDFSVTYTFSGTAALATSEIRQLVFKPVANRVTPGTIETTFFSIAVNDGIAPITSNSNTSVDSLSIDDPSTITGAVAGQAVNDSATLSPFTGVTISDVRAWTLNAKAMAKTADSSFKLQVKLKKKKVLEQDAKFTAAFKNVGLAATLASSLPNADAKKTAAVVTFNLVLNQTLYKKGQNMIYSAKRGKLEWRRAQRRNEPADNVTAAVSQNGGPRVARPRGLVFTHIFFVAEHTLPRAAGKKEPGGSQPLDGG